MAATRIQTKYIVLHCSATRPSQNIGAAEIRRWHTDPPKWVIQNGKRVNVGGQGWSDIGYHFVIRRDGTLEAGRPLNAVGSHVAGHNHNTIGICLVGGIAQEGRGWPPENNFTAEQWATLKDLVRQLLKEYPGATILGHRDFPNVNKACPSFDARAWARANGFRPAPSLKAGVPQTIMGPVIGEGASGPVFEASGSLKENADPIAEALNLSTSYLTEAAQYVTYFGYAVRILGWALAAYGLYRASVMIWRYFRGERDYGIREEDESAHYSPHYEEQYELPIDTPPEPSPENMAQGIASYVNRVRREREGG